MDERLDVALGGEAVPACLERCAQLAEIVDLAVADDDGTLVFVENRLLSGVEIDDRQAAHADSHRTIDEMPDVVGPAVGDDVGHGSQNGTRVGPGTLLSIIKEAANAAHQSRSEYRRSRRIDATWPASRPKKKITMEDTSRNIAPMESPRPKRM